MTATLSSNAVVTRRIATSTFWLSGQNQQQHCVDSTVTDPVQCFKLLRELNGQVSAYHQLATSLGTSSGDGQNLRGRLKRTRRRARQLASTVRRFILTLDNVAGESSGRLWCLLYCCLYVLALEMQRTLQLQCTFALYPAAGFINTGLVVVQQQEQHQNKQKKKRKVNKNRNGRLQNHESSCLVDDDDDVPLADLLSLERAEINQLQQEIEELEGALQELRTNYNVVEIESYLTLADSGGGQLDRLQGDSSVCQHHNRSIMQTTCHYYSNDSGASSGYCNVADDSVGSSSSSYPDDDQDEEDEEDSTSVVNQRRCLCVVMAIVIIVFILATILGAAL
ncbi:uncharacterized protein LOC130700128 [Daphnia carinata]|uniref:uncharacterized protein LOC130700128 n=1 Tax=Daphnia carinata TaxID=120202 RepID=UPI00257B4DCA|nr:uncharacterized protein LOC130700128 [Daphnia carinata]